MLNILILPSKTHSDQFKTHKQGCHIRRPSYLDFPDLEQGFVCTVKLIVIKTAI